MLGSSVLQYAGVLLAAAPLILVDCIGDVSANNSRRRYRRREYYYHHHNDDNNDNDSHNGRHDVIAVTTCEARCWKSSNKNACVKSCLAKGWEKYGSCPNLIQINDDGNDGSTTISPFYLPCLNECKKDSDCPGIGKCCKHHCGSTCQSAQNLDNSIELPEIPNDIHVRTRKKKAVYIKWKTPSCTGTASLNNGNEEKQEHIFYIVEERHHSGKYFIENDLGDWTTCLRTGKSSALLRNFIKPGRWYQFRVAAVNENGTRGFSFPVRYIAQIGPRPPKAPEVVVGPLWLFNETLHTELKWTTPQSDLPIQKYKVFWSKRLFGVTALDSVLVLQQTVTGDINKYTIHDLESNSMYFIQVQAITQYGKDVLRGEKSGYVLNTTNYRNLTSGADKQELSMSVKNCNVMKNIDDLQLQKLYWSKTEHELKARFTWKPNGKNVKYNISWSSGSCKNNNKTSQHKLAATTRHSHFDIYDLHFDCRYKVNVKELNKLNNRKAKSQHSDGKRGNSHPHKSMYDTSVTFTTPSCKDLQSRYKRLKCKGKHRR